MTLETVAAESRYGADKDSISAFSVLLDGSRWMVFMNTITQVAHWDFVRAMLARKGFTSTLVH